MPRHIILNLDEAQILVECLHQGGLSNLHSQWFIKSIYFYSESQTEASHTPECGYRKFFSSKVVVACP